MADQKNTNGDVPSYSVHTMPKEFKQTVTKSYRGLYIVMTIVLILFVGAAAVAAFLYTQTPQQPVAVEPTTPIVPDQPEQPDAPELPEKPDIPEPLEPEQPELPPIFGDIFSISSDIDLDGLTDSEEALYGTSSSRPDTDGDGHTDSAELVNLFDPALVAPAVLEDSIFIDRYDSVLFDYSFLYPAAWPARSVNPDETDVILSASTGEFVEVQVYENTESLSVIDWYTQQSPDIQPSQLEPITLKSGLRGIRTIDGLTYVVVQPVATTIVPDDQRKNLIYVVSYNPGSRVELSFRKTFEMIIASFEVISEAVLNEAVTTSDDENVEEEGADDVVVDSAL